MRFFYIACSLLIGSALVGYNLYQFKAATESVRLINEVAEVLNKQGRQRYEIQSYYTRLANTENLDIRTLQDVNASGFFDSDYALSSDIAHLYSPREIEHLQNKKHELKKAKEDFRAILLAQNSMEESVSSLYLWTNTVIDLLDDIQTQHINLSRHLSTQLVNRLKNSVIVNAITLSATFIFLFMMFMLSYRKQVQQLKNVSRQVEARNKELSTSKKLLLSLMEDLGVERESAVLTSKKMINANQQLQIKNQEMEQFIYTVSHDLKTPLVAIGGFTQRLRNTFKGSVDEKSLHQLSRIDANVEHMETLLNDLLQLSKIIRLGIEKNEVNVYELLQRVINALNITPKNAEVVIESPFPLVLANEKLLFQCFQNLLNNAIQYKHPERPVKIQVKGIKTDSFVLISVSDNGIGIEEKHYDKVFRIFERLDIGEGTGVGLAIVKTVVEKHGGEVSISSEVGLGTTFNLKFPLK